MNYNLLPSATMRAVHLLPYLLRAKTNAVDMYLWQRLPADQIGPLLEAYQRNDYAAVLTILNRHQVAPSVLTMCCGIGPAWAQIELKIKEGWNN